MEDYGWASCVVSICIAVVLLIIAAIVGGTFRTEVPLYISELPENGRNQISFEKEFGVRHWLGGLVRGKQADLNPVLQEYYKDGYELSRISVKTRHSALDLFLTGVTLGIYSPMKLSVNAKLVRATP